MEKYYCRRVGVVFSHRDQAAEIFRRGGLDICARQSFVIAGLAIATVVLVLCAPFVNPPQKDHEPKPPPPVAAEEPPRVGVKLRRGETLATVLTRFGVKPPSAHAIIDKVRPFVNPRQIRPGHDVQVVLSA